MSQKTTKGCALGAAELQLSSYLRKTSFACVCGRYCLQRPYIMLTELARFSEHYEYITTHKTLTKPIDLSFLEVGKRRWARGATALVDEVQWRYTAAANALPWSNLQVKFCAFSGRPGTSFSSVCYPFHFSHLGRGCTLGQGRAHNHRRNLPRKHRLRKRGCRVRLRGKLCDLVQRTL